MNILVVEDCKINCHFFLTILRKAGHEVRSAGNGAVALELLKRQPADIVLMDVHMPVMDGLEATRRVRAGYCNGVRNIPIIAVTASVSIEQHQACLLAGMNEVLIKPVLLHDLLVALDRLSPSSGGDSSPGSPLHQAR